LDVLKSYAVRYSLLAVGLSALFVIAYAVGESISGGAAAGGFLVAAGPDDWLVLTLPLGFTALAYAVGRQRDRVVTLAREREAFNDVLRTLLRASDPDVAQALSHSLAQMTVTMGAEAAALLTIDHGDWSVRAASTRAASARAASARAATSLTAVDWVQLSAILPWPPLATQPIVTCSFAVPSAPTNKPRRAVCAAVYAEGQPAGWLALAEPQQREIDDVLGTLADQIGVALARTQQVAAVRRRARDLEAITQMNRLLLAGRGLDELLDTIVNSAQVRFGLPYVMVMWIDEAAGEFYIRAQAGPLTDLAVTHFRQKLTDGLAGQVLRTGQPYLARDTQQEPAYISAVRAPIRSLLLVPMKTVERTIGVMTFESQAVDAFRPEDVSALVALTDQAAIAAANAAVLSEAQRKRQQVGAILHSTSDVVLLFDAADRVQLLNPAAERLLGVSAAAVVGHPIELQLPFPAVLEAYQQHRLDEVSLEATLDNDLTYLVTITTAKDETGARFGRVVIMRDITYLKRLDQFKSQMVQMTSHDLRTPLGVAIGYLDVLKEDLQPIAPERERIVQGVETALNRMQAIITDLLDLEHVESGVDQLRVRIDVGSLTAEAVAEYVEAAHMKRQQLELARPPDLPPVVGDPIRLKQAIGNLINNAVKYTPEGGAIQVRVLQSEEQRIVIEVQDNGYGIPAEAQSKLFQRFYRVRIPGAAPIEGTGLGLSLVKAVVEQQGGRVAVESEQGKGSTFRIWLPVAEQ
jgi:PAS domain S-box-containing protein